MSDETSPATLRLKPRLQPDRIAEAASPPAGTPEKGNAVLPLGEPIATVPSPIQKEVSGNEPLSTREAAVGVAESAADSSRFKLKPKASPPGDSPKPALAIATAPKSEPAAPVLPQPNAAEGGEAARFKLKPKAAANGELAMAPAAPVVPPRPAASTPPPAAFPPPPLAKGAPPSALPAKTPLVQAPRVPIDPKLLKRRKSDQNTGFKGGALAIAGLVIVLLGVGGVFSFGIYQKLTKVKQANAEVAPPASAASTKQSPSPGGATTASSALKPGALVVDNPTSDAGKLVAKARDTVAAHDKSALVQGVDEVLDDAPKPSSASKPVVLAPMQASSAPAPAVAEEPVATPPPPEEPVPEPSRAFRDFVVNMRVSGVFQGTPARVLINGKMSNESEIIDYKLGIILFQVDPQKKLLVFKDATGASMSRRY